MEYCELGDLSMFIKKREKLITNPATHDMARKYPSAPNSGLNEVLTRHFIKQLVSALQFLRNGNFVHRDVKPQNLLLLPSPDYRESHKATKPILTGSQDSLIPMAGLTSLPMLKLADFGFARVLPSTTLAETLCGSPLYMAPEILRYERYDAKADLWSVGTVIYEMVAGRPPFRASNHVELLRKIEAAEDLIRFPRDCVVSTEMKAFIRSLLKRNPVERLSFESLFEHNVIKGPIPGLVEDDIPRLERPRLLESVTEHRPSSRDQRPTALPSTSPSSAPRTDDVAQSPTAAVSPGAGAVRRQSFNRYIPKNVVTPPAAAPEIDRESALAAAAAGNIASSPRDRTGLSRADSTGQRPSQSPRHGSHDPNEGLAVRRPTIQPSTSAPARPAMYDERKQQHRLSNASMKQYQNQGQTQQHQHHQSTAYEDPSPTSSLRNELTVNDVGDSVDARGNNTRSNANAALNAEQEKAAQDIAFERDYVLVEKKHVEVNAFADEMAANPRLAAQYQTSPKSGHAIVRRATQQGHPTSATGAVAPNSSRAMQVAQGTVSRPYHGDRPSSLSASPNSTTSFIAKAIHDASFRLLGVKNPVTLIGKGASPPQLYSPFPAYPTPSAAPAAAALITDGRTSGSDGVNAGPADSDARVAQLIEDYATRSDVVFGFAEVKYKQLVPLVPSAEHDLSGVPVSEKLQVPSDDEDELTIDAIVVLSEEALVLYVKALSLLAKSMDIASMWWRSKMRGDSTGNGSASHLLYVRESPLGLRVNAAVQWIRSRFNEVLEKANFARERLVEVQRRLPEDHPSHPSNHTRDDESGVGSVGATAGSGTDGVFLSAGVSAEKLMYDRAVEMSRAAAIGEISNDDLSGCELSYMTAICMLEAVLDTDDEPLRRRSSASGKDEKSAMRDDDGSDINTEDQKTVEFMINMIKTRLNAVRKKAHLISSHSKAALRQDLVRRRSGDVTPRSVPSHAS